MHSHLLRCIVKLSDYPLYLLIILRGELREADFSCRHHRHEFIVIDRRIDQHFVQIWGVLLLSLKFNRRTDGLCLTHEVILEHVLPHDLMSTAALNI